MMSGNYSDVVDQSPPPEDTSNDVSHPMNYTFGDKTGAAAMQHSSVPGRDAVNAMDGIIKTMFGKLPNPASNTIINPATTKEFVNAAMMGIGGGGAQLVAKSPELLAAGKGAAELFKPGLASQQFVKNLGGGTAERNISSIAGKVQDAHDANLAEALATKKDVMKQTADVNNIYKEVDPYSYNAPQASMGQRISQNYHQDILPDIDNPNVLDAHEAFMKKPNFENADNLQSEIGKRMGYLQRQSRQYQLDSQGFNELKTLKGAQKAIHGDQENFLNSVDPKLNEQYNLFKEQYKNNVVPYYSSDLLRNITRDRATTGITPSQIKTEFAFPDSDASKVASDIGETGRNNILYNELNSKPNMNPKDSIGIRNMMSEMKQKGGYEQYVTPELENMMNSWKIKEGAREKLGYGAGIAGLATGHPYIGGVAATYFSGKPLLQKLLELKGVHIK